MKAMAMVAHPDDCVIFAYGFMYHNADYEWTVCYLTYTESHARGAEINNFWRQRNIPTKFLGFPDNWNHELNCPGQIAAHEANQSIAMVIADQDLILTHNEHGEYGHPHHVLINRATQDHAQRVTFAGPGQGTVKYVLPANAYSLDELPLHRDVVESFHPRIHINEYTL